MEVIFFLNGSEWQTIGNQFRKKNQTSLLSNSIAMYAFSMHLVNVMLLIPVFAMNIKKFSNFFRIYNNLNSSYHEEIQEYQDRILYYLRLLAKISSKSYD